MRIIIDQAQGAVKGGSPSGRARLSGTALAVLAKAHGNAAVAWQETAAGWEATSVPLADAGDRAWAPPSRWVSAALLPTNRPEATDVLAEQAMLTGVRVLGVPNGAGGGIAAFCFAPVAGQLWVLTDAVDAELDRPASRGEQAWLPSPWLPAGEPAPALLPDDTGRYMELTWDPVASRAAWDPISATVALAATRRPAVTLGSEPTKGRHRPDADVRRVLEELVDADPSREAQPRILSGTSTGGVRSVRLSSKIRRQPSSFLLARGVPSLHALKACFLAVDADHAEAVEGTVRAAGGPVVGAFSGSTRAEFRALRLVLPTPPGEREALAEAVEDAIAATAAEAGLPTPDRHHARPGQMDRLPCTPSAKPGAEPGYGFLLIHGPHDIEPISPAVARRLLRVEGQGGVRARLGKAVPAATAAEAPVQRPATNGLTPSEWIAGMGAGTRALLELDADALARAFPVEHPADAAAQRVLASVYRRGGGPQDGLEVLEAAPGALGGWITRKAGRQRRAQLHRLEWELGRFLARGGESGSPRRGLAEQLWAALPTTASWEQEIAIAVLLQTLARLGRPLTGGGYTADLGGRALAEAAPVTLTTLTSALTLLGGAVEAAQTGGRSTGGDRLQTVWAFHPDRASLLNPTPGRGSLAAFTATFIDSHLGFIAGVGGVAGRALLAVRAADGPLWSDQLRDQLGVSAGTLSAALRRLERLGLVRRRPDRSTPIRQRPWIPGEASPAGIAARHGGVAEAEARRQAHLAEREAEDALYRADDRDGAGDVLVPEEAATPAPTSAPRLAFIPTQRTTEAAMDDLASPSTEPDPVAAGWEALAAGLDGFLTSLRRRPDRCDGCGWHPRKQGHAANCPTVPGGARPLVSPTVPAVQIPASVCSECGERFADPAPLQRCHQTHSSATTLADFIATLEGRTNALGLAA